MKVFISYILLAVAIYLLIGIIFSILFLWKGLEKVDATTIESGLFFKLLIFPGLVVFWPLFVKKWRAV